MKPTFRTLIDLLTILLILSGIASAEQESRPLYDRFCRLQTDEKAVMEFIHSLSQPEVFDLCNQYGHAVDNREESDGEGMLIEAALKDLKSRSTLSSDDLLSCTGTETASLYWRLLALRYASGKSKIIDTTTSDTEKVFDFSMRLLSNTATPSILRQEACKSLTEVLIDGYYLTICGSKKKDRMNRNRVRAAGTLETKTYDEKASAFADLALKIAEDQTAPKKLRENNVPNALRAMIRERGLKTPRFDRILKIAKQHSENDKSKQSAYGNLVQEINTVANENR